jgi:hypothetical protein
MSNKSASQLRLDYLQKVEENIRREKELLQRELRAESIGNNRPHKEDHPDLDWLDDNHFYLTGTIYWEWEDEADEFRDEATWDEKYSREWHQNFEAAWEPELKFVVDARTGIRTLVEVDGLSVSG